MFVELSKNLSHTPVSSIKLVLFCNIDGPVDYLHDERSVISFLVDKIFDSESTGKDEIILLIFDAVDFGNDFSHAWCAPSCHGLRIVIRKIYEDFVEDRVYFDC